VSRYERWNGLLSLLAGRGRLSVEEAAAELNVSAATIRRDFDQLAQQQMLTRTRGGAVAQTVTYDLPLRYKSARRASDKQRIAAVAAGLVKRGAVVGINGGTTTTEVARALATRGDLRAEGGAHALTVVTNALNIAAELVVRPHIKIVLTGGVALPQSYELVGPLARGVFDQVSAPGRQRPRHRARRDLRQRGRGRHQPADGGTRRTRRRGRGRLQARRAGVRQDLRHRRDRHAGHRRDGGRPPVRGGRYRGHPGLRTRATTLGSRRPRAFLKRAVHLDVDTLVPEAHQVADGLGLAQR
jgi:DNA-binding transcriptional regulator YhcF (GntR family)